MQSVFVGETSPAIKGLYGPVTSQQSAALLAKVGIQLGDEGTINICRGERRAAMQNDIQDSGVGVGFVLSSLVDIVSALLVMGCKEQNP